MKKIDGEKPKHRVLKIFIKLFVILVILGGVAFGVKFGPNYISKEITDKTNKNVIYTSTKSGEGF